MDFPQYIANPEKEGAFLKKAIGILLLSVLLLVTLAACGRKEIPVAVSPDVDYPPKFPYMEGVEPLTDSMVAEIEQAFREQNGYDMKWFNWDNIVTRHFGYIYMGTVDGYVILLASSSNWNSEGIFQFPPLPQYYKTRLNVSGYAYKDGQIVSVGEIDMDREKAKVIYDRYCALETTIFERDDLDDPYTTITGELPPPLEECPYLQEDLVAAGIPEQFFAENGLKAKYLGTYHGCIVFATRNPFDSGLVSQGLPVCVYALHDFYVFRNGEEYDLNEAFLYGYLTEDDVRTIVYYMYGERLA